MSSKVTHVALATVIFIIWMGTIYASLKKGGTVAPGDYLCDDLKVMDGVHWWYDWEFNLNGIIQKSGCANLDQNKSTFIPMIWGDFIDRNATAYKEAAYILGYNEPNHEEQSNLTPRQAAAHWPIVEKIGVGKKLVSPSAAPCGSPSCHGNTTAWFDEFFRLCKGCRVDYLATHKYHCNAQTTMEFLEDLYKRYGKEIWLTEFACPETDDPEKELAYMKEILPRLEAAPYVFRYSWFMFRIKGTGFVKSAASLFKQNSSELTELGKFYNSYTPESSSESESFFSMAVKFFQHIFVMIKNMF